MINAAAGPSASPTADRPWLSRVTLVCIFTGCIAGYFLPRPAGWPGLFALLAAGAGLLAGRVALRRLPLAGPLALFWLSALWAAALGYNPAAAWTKFWTLSAAVAIFYAVAALRADDAPRLGLTLTALAAAIAAVFLLAHNWAVQPADYGWINRLAGFWMALRPQVFDADPLSGRPQAWVSLALSQNVAGGLLAALLPFALFAWASARKQGRLPAAFCVACAVVALAGLVMSSSRAAWLSLAAAGGLWALWRLDGFLPERRAQAYRRVRAPLLLAGLALAALAGALALARMDTLVTLFDRTPGFPSAQSRAQLAVNSLRLVKDFPFTGGGLASFPGLYSQYLLNIPHYLFGYSHNLYLDVAVEQGPLGLAALLAALGAGVWLCLRRGGDRPGPAGLLAQAALVSLVSMLLHGLGDDAFYGDAGTPLLFLAAGAAVYAARGGESGSVESTRQTGRRRLLAVLPLLALAVAAVWGRTLVSLAHSNRAALAMARVELAGFPSGRWQAGEDLAQLEDARQGFARALAWDARNLTASYRLGLIAMQRRDFPQACSYLEQAQRIDPGHRGVVKSLGLCLTWQGQFEAARPYLLQIPEARRELEAYSTWWRQQGEDRLAEFALQMINALQ